VDEREDLMEKGFQLASFILQDRSTAIRVVRDATNKLTVQHSREQKRSYWRDKHLKGRITRIVRENRDALQWLIYFEAESYEKQHEELGQQTLRDMIIRYVKHLVQISTPMSAFYVSVGLHRLLHNYSTAEVQRVYEWMTEHYPGAQEYRRVKGALMNQLQARFAKLIQTIRGQHGEFRFEILDDQEGYADLVNACLRTFTPWSTSQPSMALGSLDSKALDPRDILLGKSPTRVDQNRVETYRCHVLINPIWYEQIARRLGLDPPRRKLAVPKFLLSTNTQDRDGPGSLPAETPKLTDEERKGITDYLAAEAARRQQASPRMLKILAHGKEYARLYPDRADRQECELPEGVKLIEIWIEHQEADVLIATHWVNYTEWSGIAAAAAIVDLGNGRELLLQIVPTDQNEGGPGGASLELKCRPASRLAALGESLRSSLSLQKMPRFALAAASLVAMGFVLGALLSKRELSRQRANVESVARELAHERSVRESLQKSLAMEHGSQEIAAYRLSPDDVLVRSPENTKETVVSLSANVPLVILDLPVAAGPAKSYRAVLTPFLQKRELLSENFAQPAQAGGDMSLRFALPSSLVEDGQHYVINLESKNAAGKLEMHRTFTFLVVRK
jgi:hypothetical protein